MMFTVIIPTYNRSFYLNKCLQFLCNQSFKNFEVIVCDDGSTDDTITVLQKYTSLLNLIYITINNSGGPAKPRNEAIKIASGDWLCFLDVDDLWFENKLLICSEHTDEADFLYHDLLIQDQNEKIKGVYKGRDLRNDKYYDLLTNFNAIATSSVCIKRTVFLDTGWFDESLDYRFIEDFDYWLRVASTTNRFKYIAQNLGVYVEHSTNSSHDFIAQAKRIEKLYFKCLQKIKDPRKKKNINNACHYQIGCLYEKSQELKIAQEHFMKSIYASTIIVSIKSLYKAIKYAVIIRNN